MKRLIVIAGTGLLLLLVLSAAVSGERRVTDGTATAATVQKGVADEDTRQAQVQPVEEVSAGIDETTVDVIQHAPAVAAGADAYEIPWQSINAGGDDMQSTNYQMMSSVGQSVIGYATSATYEHGIGYWYGMGENGGDCVCGTPVGDANCDAAMNPVDVVYMVNFVYKNQDARCYPPGWNCSYDLGDVDCNGGVNPVDIVYYVNNVYKNQNAFCDPCVD
jgi:hypothetical protein